jgi:hypothetical protein
MSTPPGQPRPPRPSARTTQRRRQAEAEAARAARRRRITIGALITGVVVIAVLIVVLTSGSGRPNHATSTNADANADRVVATSSGPEGEPIPDGPPLASPSPDATGAAVDGIQCSAGEQVAYHIHAHLSIFVDGQPSQIPGGIGIPGAQSTQAASGPFVTTGQCFYWLHTHTADGIIHVESPTQQTYTLGNFFNVWHQPLTTSRVGPATGRVTAYVDGKLFSGDPSTIVLAAHRQIQLDVGRVLAFQPVIFQPTL